MSEPTIEIRDAAVRRALDGLEAALEDRRALHGRMGHGVALLVRRHCLAKNQQPNKRGWPKTGFYGRERAQKTIHRADDASATVSVASAAMGGSIWPAAIRRAGRCGCTTCWCGG